MADEPKLDDENTKELTDTQVEQIDAIDNAAFDLLNILAVKKDDEDLEWDMEMIGDVIDTAVAVLHEHGFDVYYPYIEEDENGNQSIHDYDTVVECDECNQKSDKIIKANLDICGVPEYADECRYWEVEQRGDKLYYLFGDNRDIIVYDHAEDAIQNGRHVFVIDIYNGEDVE